MLIRLKRKIIRRLAALMADVQQQSRPSPAASLSPGAVILPEGIVDNPSGNVGLITIGERSHIRGRLFVYPNGGSIKIGSWCYVGSRSEIWSMNSVVIGDRVLISHDVNIIDNTGHSKDAPERHAHFRQIIDSGHPRDWTQLPGVKSAPIVIEDDAWINCGVIILQGVRIGARSVIAAGSIVTHDVPADMIYRNEIKPILKPLKPSDGSTQNQPA